MNNLQPLIVIVGPTAVGKTDIAIEVAKRVDGEIVSADSMLVYRGMDIGTAKPSNEEMQGIPHYMIDVVDPDEEFSVAMYQKAARDWIDNINQRGKMPLLVGGTGLYVKAVIDPYDFTPAPCNETLREQLREEAQTLGAAAMHKRLAQVDPASADRLHPNDVRRVIRALEVYYQTGKPFSQYQSLKTTGDPIYKLLMFGLTMDRTSLYQRIEQRVDLMVDQGLVNEVTGLLTRYKRLDTSMQGLGYKEIAAYLTGECTLEEALEVLKRDTRHFAKRQLTWFKADDRIRWLRMEDFSNKEAVASEIVKQIAGEFL